jgi:hypothetical protein
MILTGIHRLQQIAAVLDAPALFNRATRRSIGLYGRHWRWDLNAHEDTRREYMPRYIRRHYSLRSMIAPQTRRQRRERARINKIIQQKGVV